MNIKSLTGAGFGWFTNFCIAWVPSRRLRLLWIRRFSGGIGARTGVQLGCRFLHLPKLTLGSGVVINWGSVLDGRRYPIQIGDNVSIGPRATILTLGHDPQDPSFSDKGGPVTIGNRAWLGYGCIILPGVSIGEGAIVGAGTVVARDVEPFTIVVGNPARVVGERTEKLMYELEYFPWLS